MLADYGPAQEDTFPARPRPGALAFVELGPGIGRPDATGVLDRVVIS